MPALPESAVYPLHTPAAHVIRDGAEALAVARQVAAILLEQDAERDRTREVPAQVVDLYSNSGLWGISVPREFGGAQVSYAVLAEVIAIISAADPSLGQIPQNHYCLLEDIRLQGTPEQQAHFFALALQGHRFANALSETGGKNVQDIQATIRRSGDGYVINGRKGYCTGSLYAHWLAVLALDEQGRGQLAFVPRAVSYTHLTLPTKRIV